MNKRLDAVRRFADCVLTYGSDRWSGSQTPLFVDGIRVADYAPVEWIVDGKHFVISNLANQQNLLRTLVGLSTLTGEEKYELAARSSVAYMFDHFRSPCGLLYWGGHSFVDLGRLTVVHLEGPHMEIKSHRPYYELMYSVDSTATARLIRAFWNGNMRDWRRMELNRHAPYGKPLGSLWASEWDEPEPLYETEFSGSVMPFTDMIWAAVMLDHLADEPDAVCWARRMQQMLARAAHPETGLGPVRATRMRSGSRYGSGWRFDQQFRPEFGEMAIQAWSLWGSGPLNLYGEYVLAQIGLFDVIGETVADFLDLPINGLKAYAYWAYDRERNHFRALWADGTDMTGYVTKRPGKDRMVGAAIRPIPADGSFLLTYARAWRASSEQELWMTSRAIGLGLGLGDIGVEPDSRRQLNAAAACDDPFCLLALLELFSGTQDQQFLSLAQTVGDAIVKHRFRNELFVSSSGQRWARFDAVEPLALLHLEAAFDGRQAAVPAFVGGARRYLQGPYDGRGRITDQKLFYQT